MDKALRQLFLALVLCSCAFGQGILGPVFQPQPVAGGGGTTVTRIGSCQANFTTSCTITGVTAGVGTGIVVLGSSTAAPTVTSVTVANSGTANSWQADIFSATNQVSANSAYIANALSGATLTITLAAGGSDAWGFVAYELSSMQSSSWLDASNNGVTVFGSTGTVSTSAGTSHQPNINFVFFQSSTTNTDSVSGYTALEGSTGNAGVVPSRTIWAFWKRTTTTGTQSGAWTFASNDNPFYMILSYKAN